MHEHLGRSIERSRPNLTSTSPHPRKEQKSEDKTLWARVFRLAVLDALGASALGAKDNREQLRAEALQWILSPHDGPATFRWTCALFNLSPLAVKEAVTKEVNRRIPDKTSRRPMNLRVKYWTTN